MKTIFTTAAALAVFAAVPAFAQEEAPKPDTAAKTEAPAKTETAEEVDGNGSEWLKRHRLRLDWQPVGASLGKGDFSFGNQIRMRPAGFRADEFNLYFGPTYGLGGGWEITAGATGAERIGDGGEAIFYGFGVQKQILAARKGRPAVSVGGFGMAGPHDHHAGNVFLAGTQRIWSQGQNAAYAHAGARYEIFESDDYGDGTGIRPFLGATVAFGRRWTLNGDWSPNQAWESKDLWSVRATVRLHKWFALSGGVRSSGYRTEPFIGFSF